MLAWYVGMDNALFYIEKHFTSLYKFQQLNEETYLYIHYVLVTMCQINIHGKCTTHLHRAP